MDWLSTLISNSSYEVVISVIAGVFVLSAQSLIGYFRSIPALPRYKAYEGEYHLYCLHTDGSNKIISMRMHIKRRFNRLLATIITFNDTYEGSVRFTPRNVYVDLAAKNHNSFVQIIFLDPFFPVVNKIWGIGSCVSVQSEPCALRFLLSRKELSEIELQEEFKGQPGTNSKHIMLVKTGISIYKDNSKEGVAPVR